MDMRALKIGQKVNVHLFSQVKEATVTKMTQKYERGEFPPSGPFRSGCQKMGRSGSGSLKMGSWRSGSGDRTTAVGDQYL